MDDVDVGLANWIDHFYFGPVDQMVYNTINLKDFLDLKIKTFINYSK